MLLKIPRVIKNWKSPSFFGMPDGNFIDNGFGRRFLSHADAQFSYEAFKAFGVTKTLREINFAHFVGNHYLDGAFTLPHKDTSPNGYIHTRCNWMVKKPPSGGDPILDGVVVPVEEGDLWICFASHEIHSSTPISGGERLICSFGALVPIAALSHIIKEQP